MIGGIRRKVLLVALVPAVAIAIVLATYFVSGQVAGLQQQLEDQGTAIARHLAPASEFGVFSGNRTILRRLAAATRKESNVRSVRISYADGRILASSGPEFLPSSQQIAGNQAVDILPSKDGSAIVFRSPVLQTQMEISDFRKWKRTQVRRLIFRRLLSDGYRSSYPKTPRCATKKPPSSRAA